VDEDEGPPRDDEPPRDLDDPWQDSETEASGEEEGTWRDRPLWGDEDPPDEDEDDDEDSAHEDSSWRTRRSMREQEVEEHAHTSEALAARRAEERARHRRDGHRRLAALVGAIAIIIVLVITLTSGGSSKPPAKTTGKGPSRAAHQGTGHSYLAAGSDSSVLPQNILIADRNNSRLLSISPKGQVVWDQTQSTPSDAYLSSTGHTAIVTQHTQAIVLERLVDSGHVSFIYGHVGHAGSADNFLSDPQTGQETAKGEVVIADLGNCRIVFINSRVHKPVKTLGSTGHCVHQVISAPVTFDHPDAAFPTSDGGLVVTEQSSPGYVDVFNAKDALTSSIQLSSTFTAPYDANEFAPGKLIIVNRASPGLVEEFTTSGSPLWTWPKSGSSDSLNKPSLARVLPNGDVLIADSGNDRVIVVDPTTNKIVWQYGHTGKSGTAPGYLHTPDSVVLVPTG
jgi:hypothetical protein